MHWNEQLIRVCLAFCCSILLTDGAERPYPIPVEPGNPTPQGRPEVSVPPSPVRVVQRGNTSPTGLGGTGHVSGFTRDPEVSWYGPGFYGKRTACGLAYTKGILGVAHRALPCGTKVEFRYNGRSKIVPVIDRGPYVEGRQWDLSGGLCTFLRHCFTGPIEWRFP